MIGVCVVCGNGIKSGVCKHPWHKPFCDWPEELLAQIRRLAPQASGQ